MKKKLVMFLLLMLSSLWILPLTAQNSTQNVPPSKTNSAKEYGIDLAGNYSGEQVWELVQILLEESDSAIGEAYARGYRQGALLAEGYRQECESLRRSRWTFGGIGACAGALAAGGIFAAVVQGSQ